MRSALIIGGSGALGSSCVTAFLSHQWKPISMDLTMPKDPNVQFVPWNIQELSSAEKRIREVAAQLPKLSAIVCVAGGWAGGNIESDCFLETCHLMHQQSVASSLVAARLARELLCNQGLLVLTGAQAALSETPGMIGYGMAKAAVHFLTRSLAQEGSGMPIGARVAAILPNVLDTPGNRAAMPSADYSSWTPTEEIANKIVKWAVDPTLVTNGALIKVSTEKGITSYL